MATLVLLGLPLASAFYSHGSVRCTRRTPGASPSMGALEWNLDYGNGLPLLATPMRDALLPGESRRLVVEKADELAAIEAAQKRHHGCIGMLLRTPHDNALATAPLLEIREVKKRDVGAVVDVVAVGRVQVHAVQSERYLLCRRLTKLKDSDQVGIIYHEADAKLVATVRESADQLRKLLKKLDEADDKDEEDDMRGVVVPTGRAVSADEKARVDRLLVKLDEAAERRREELCAVDLDRPALDSLERLHELWGVKDEEAAEELLFSFAAAAPLSALGRAKALGITNTAERLTHADAALRRAVKVAAAKLAVRTALA